MALERPVIALGIDTWASLWPQWLQGGENLGESAAFWANTQLFALHLMERWAYLPVLQRSRDGYEARWSPRFVGNTREMLEDLLERMPDSARALNFDASVPPAQQRRRVVEQILVWMIDEHARRLAREMVDRFPASSHSGKWQTALSHPIATMQGDKASLERFQAVLLEWQQGIELESKCGYRLLFRILEPAGEGREGWLLAPYVEDLLDADLSYPLRAVEDLDLRGGRLAGEAAWSNFAQATRICPMLSAFDSHIGEGIYLPGDRVIDFLNRWAPLLEKAGFRVEWPAWWREGNGIRVALSGELNSAPTVADDRSAMATKVRLDWQAILGDKPVTIEELTELARRPGELQVLRGSWMRVDPQSVRDAVRFLRHGRQREMSARDALREVFGLSGGRNLDVTGIRSEGWVGELLDRLRDPAQIKAVAIPAGFRGEMRPYQRRGFAWLQFLTQFGLGACLADDMGLGKSLQMLAMIAGRRGEGKPALLICPTSVIGNWEREAQKFFPDLKALVHHGVNRVRGAEFAALAIHYDLVISSYSLLHRDEETFAGVDWDGIVLDEAQNIKNFETKQSRAARHLPGGYRVALTGTPVENHVKDLYSLMEFLNPGLLGSPRDFQQRFFKPIQNDQSEKATRQLRSLTAPFILRRLKTDRTVISDLPDKMEMKTYCKLTREQALLYQDVMNGCFVDLEGRTKMERRGLILATISRLKQVCNHPAQLLKEKDNLKGRSGKLTRLTEMLEEVLESGEKALIFSQFAEMGEILSSHIAGHFGRPASFLHGGTPRRERERLIADFEKPEGASLFVLSLKAGGTGLNLVAANHVFHFDRWWNPAVENQATDRAFRIGQTKAVQVHKFVCMGTIEERIDQMVEQKRGIAEKVVEAGEVWLTEMSNQELRDLFSLSREAWED